MFAIVQIGGKQYQVKEKDVLRVEKVEALEGKTFSSKDIRLLHNEKHTKVGTPYVSGASVDFKVIKTALGDKVISFKMKAKKRYKRLKGHRQPFSELEVVQIKSL